jgi:tRNA 2-selenouridine synthase
VIARWQDWAQAGALPPLFAELVALHYDPLYARSQSTHLHQWAARHSLASDDLSEAGIDALAAQVLALG